MKTNHQRGFVATKDPKACEIKSKHYRQRSNLVDRDIGASAHNFDSTDGKHGIAKSRHGAKKFVHSRFRFHENMEVRKIGKFCLLTQED